MDSSRLSDVLVTPLRRIPTRGGDVLHALKATDPGFAGFGEAYFSLVDAGAVKAWKRHRRMTLNLVVAVGCVKFVLREPGASGAIKIEEIGGARYARLTVPPGLWVGFQGLALPQSVVLNLADLPHDPDEIERCPVEAFPFAWQERINL